MSAAERPAAPGLRVVLDVRHPLAYLALGPAIRLGREVPVAIDWLPFAAQPLRPPSTPGPADDRGARHRRHRAHMIAREIAVYADVQGLTLREPYRGDPADAAHLAWLWVRRTAPRALTRFLEELFRRYWSLALRSDSAEDAADAVGSCGLDPGAFRQWAAGPGPAALRQAADAVAELGVFQTPAFVLGGEVFYGRQHLPMIRWLLRGRSGPPPI